MVDPASGFDFGRRPAEPKIAVAKTAGVDPVHLFDGDLSQFHVRDIYQRTGRQALAADGVGYVGRGRDLAGMMLQVRAFLYLGIVFLLLALVTMVSHAHQRFEHVWPWWAFGFTLGVAILVMFGLFEKKKKEMGQVLGQLRQWDL